MLKVKSLMSQSIEELELQYLDLSRKIFDLTNQLKLTRKLDQPHLLSKNKRDRARVLTVLRQKQVKET